MGIDLKDSIIEQIKEIGEKYNINKIVLFGSRARSDNNKKSDIDLAIYYECELKKGSIFADIDDIETLLKFDIIFMNAELSYEILQNIEKDGVTLYEKI
ncbi:MAG: nucleotidyltransferase domain-containing protein [Acidaminobacteraceae bacterium]